MKIRKVTALRGQICWLCNRNIAGGDECIEAEAKNENGNIFRNRFHLACSITFSEETLHLALGKKFDETISKNILEGKSIVDKRQKP